MLPDIYKRAMNCMCLSASNLIDCLVVVNNAWVTGAMVLADPMNAEFMISFLI